MKRGSIRAAVRVTIGCRQLRFIDEDTPRRSMADGRHAVIKGSARIPPHLSLSPLPTSGAKLITTNQTRRVEHGSTGEGHPPRRERQR